MPQTKPTVFQRLGLLLGNGQPTAQTYDEKTNKYNINSDTVIFKTRNKEEYENEKIALHQQHLLARQWIRAQYDVANKSLAGLTDVKIMYRDADLMDLFPEIGAALDILMEESCLSGDTKIKLLNGSTETIKSLFDSDANNFWVYSVDENGLCKPSKVERVISKGVKPIYEISLDDGTKIKCTEDHKWLTTENIWVETKDLEFGQSLTSIYSRFDKNGNEEISSTKEKTFSETCRMVDENVLAEEKLKIANDNRPSAKYYAEDSDAFCEAKRVLREMPSITKIEMANKLGLKEHSILKMCKVNGYKNFNDLKKNCFSHRVISIKKLNTTENVYDLVNSSTNNCFAVECNGGMVISHNCYTPNNSFMVNVSSKSERIKAILQDLLYNKLSIHMMLPMVCRSTCKYGNTFMLLNIDRENGVIGWRQLPVYEMERYENGMDNPYAQAFAPKKNIDIDADDSIKFVWVGQNEFIPYQNWQIAHFRLLYDSLYMPYGVSALNKARRHFRMLSMMEDMMLIYRMDRSMERRVFKINVGAIDEADVPAYVQQIADNFKRTPIVDPLTGQLDLRKNIMANTDDFFIPVRDSSEGSPIETLSAGNNLTAMDDIKYIQNKVFTALRVPKPFLNFEEAQAGEGKNASMLDVRFMRTVNKIQQMLLIELNKICIIHLYLLGFTDDLTNFSLTMNNPSSVAEQLEIENLAKKITAAKDATADPGNGFPLMSMTRAWKEILGWSEKDIQDNLNELRLEKALATELSLTPQIIQRTGLFDDVDNIYGEPGAQYQQNQQAGGGMDGGMGGGFGGGGMGGGDLGGGDLGGDLGTGMDMGTDLGAGIDMGAEGEIGMDAAASENAGLAGDNGAGGEEQPLMEAWNTEFFNKMLNEQKNFDTPTFNERAQKYSKMFKKRLDEFAKETPETLYDKQRAINEEYSDLTKRLGEYIANDSNE